MPLRKIEYCVTPLSSEDGLHCKSTPFPIPAAVRFLGAVGGVPITLCAADVPTPADEIGERCGVTTDFAATATFFFCTGCAVATGAAGGTEAGVWVATGAEVTATEADGVIVCTIAGGGEASTGAGWELDIMRDVDHKPKQTSAKSPTSVGAIKIIER